MPTLTSSARFSPSQALPAILRTFFDEATVVLQAIANPGKVIREVEEMRALHVEARRIEARDPARAALLQRRAARIGLR